MKKPYLLLLVFALLVGSLAICCTKSTLQPGGAYNPVSTNSAGVTTPAPDMGLFVADSAYQVAWNTLDAAFTTERNNRQMLWTISPQIKKTLDGIRPQASQFNDDYLRARAAYIANPVPTNLNGVNAV